MHPMTLRDLLRQVRVETGQSLDPAHGPDQDHLTTHILSRIQRQLAHQFDWPILSVQGHLTLAAGQKLYSLQAIPALPDHIQKTYDFQNGQIDQICLGNHVLTKLSTSAIRADLSIRGLPTSWSYTGDSLLIWPTPDQNCPALTIYGKRAVAPLQESTDLSDLDGDLLVLFCAAEILMDIHQGKAKHKLSQASHHLQTLRAQISPTPKIFMRQSSHLTFGSTSTEPTGTISHV